MIATRRLLALCWLIFPDVLLRDMTRGRPAVEMERSEGEGELLRTPRKRMSVRGVNRLHTREGSGVAPAVGTRGDN